MKRVIDSSVAFKWVVPETYSDRAVLPRDDFCNGLVELLAPDVFPVEVGHALTRAERQGRIPVGAAFPLLRDILNTLPLLHPSLPNLLRAVEVSSQLRVGVYDSLTSPLLKANNASWSPPPTNSSKPSNVISHSSYR
jgi:predicted nucleic acid-binding protein